MKRLLLSASLVGIVFAGHTHSSQMMQVAPIGAEPLNAARAVSIVRKSAALDRSNPQNLSVQRVAFRSSATTDSSDQGAPKGSALVASVEEMFAPSLPQKTEVPAPPASEAVDENAMWVVVIRGAWMHSGPSVSAPMVGHQSPGTELHLIDSQQGWYQVFDPATSKRGWIYAKYYLEPIDRPGQKRVAVQEMQAPVTAAPMAPEPTKPARRVLQQPRFLAPPQVQAEKVQSSSRYRDEGVASLLVKAFRR